MPADAAPPALVPRSGGPAQKTLSVCQDHTTSWRGRSIKYVEVDSEFNPVGMAGEPFVLLDPPSEPPLNDRCRGAVFYLENGTLYMFSGASSRPRIIVQSSLRPQPHVLRRTVGAYSGASCIRWGCFA